MMVVVLVFGLSLLGWENGEIKGGMGRPKIYSGIGGEWPGDGGWPKPIQNTIFQI
jgi:hypothetical protein